MSNRIFIKVFSVLNCLILLAGCTGLPGLDDVLPDNRDEYKRSRTLPDLEVPPDLTLEQDDNNMEIPGEEPATLTEYQRARRQQSGASSALQTLENRFPGEQVLAVKGTPGDVWPKLEAFWEGQGYPPELSDSELGVLETGWKQEGKNRDKFKIFAESDETGLNTVLLISSDRQENVGLDDENAEWLDQESDTRKEKKLMSDLRQEFQGDIPVAPAATTPARTADTSSDGWQDPDSQSAIKAAQAEIVDAGDNKFFLTLPEEFTKAWRRTETLLLESGLFIEDKDVEKGIYYVLYASLKEEGSEEEEGFFSSLKFWGDEEPEGKTYQISLTGVGDKTELVVLNEAGEWAIGSDASEILSLLQKRYNGV